jgi:small conductance mechanosensitive channel
VGEELSADAAFADQITQPFELLGVDQLSESAVTLKGRIVTQPKAQWKVGREYNRRIKKAFDEAKIVSPFTSVQMLPSAEGEGDAEGPSSPERRSFDPRETRPQS